MTAEEVLSELKAKKYRPVYLLMGEEPYPLDQIADWVEAHVLSSEERTWNQSVLYGRETTGRAIGLECAQLPMMGPVRVVIVKEAQSTPGLQDLEKYAGNPSPQTLLVLVHKYKLVDKRGKLLKAVEKGGGAVVESAKLYDNQMPHWIAMHARSLGLEIEEKASQLLAEHVGTSMSDAASAFKKIRSAVGPELRRVTVDMVSEHVGISKEYNAFELRDALFTGNAEKALRIVRAFGDNEKQYPLPAILAALYNSFDKLFAYTMFKAKNGGSDKVAIDKMVQMGEKSYSVERTYPAASKLYSPPRCLRILDKIQEYDMRSKGYHYPDTSNRDLLVDLVAGILRG